MYIDPRVKTFIIVEVFYWGQQNFYHQNGKRAFNVDCHISKLNKVSFLFLLCHVCNGFKGERGN